MKKRIRSILIFTGLLVIILIVAIIPELVGGDIEALLRDKLGDSYLMILLSIRFFAALFLTLWSDGSSIFKSKEKEIPTQNVSDENIKKIQEALFKSYQHRIDSRLAHRYPINLEMKYSTEGSTSPLLDNKAIRSTKIKEALIDLFEEHKDLWQRLNLIIDTVSNHNDSIITQDSIRRTRL